MTRRPAEDADVAGWSFGRLTMNLAGALAGAHIRGGRSDAGDVAYHYMPRGRLDRPVGPWAPPICLSRWGRLSSIRPNRLTARMVQSGLHERRAT